MCITRKTAKEIRTQLKIKLHNYVSENIIKPLIAEGLIDYTNKNNINAKNQKYVTIKKP